MKLLNKEASTHAFIVIDRDLDQLDLKAQVARSEHLQARKRWQHLPASPRVSRVLRYTACWDEPERAPPGRLNGCSFCLNRTYVRHSVYVPKPFYFYVKCLKLRNTQCSLGTRLGCFKRWVQKRLKEDCTAHPTAIGDTWASRGRLCES